MTLRSWERSRVPRSRAGPRTAAASLSAWRYLIEIPVRVRSGRSIESSRSGYSNAGRQALGLRSPASLQGAPHGLVVPADGPRRHDPLGSSVSCTRRQAPQPPSRRVGNPVQACPGSTLRIPGNANGQSDTRPTIAAMRHSRLGHRCYRTANLLLRPNIVAAHRTMTYRP